MKKETQLVETRSIARTLSLALVGLASLTSMGCDQPVPKCTISQTFSAGGHFGARYTLVKGSKEGEGDCDQMKGEGLWFATYFAENKDQSPNYDKVSVGVQSDQFLNIMNASGQYMGTPE